MPNGDSKAHSHSVTSLRKEDAIRGKGWHGMEAAVVRMGGGGGGGGWDLHKLAGCNLALMF